MRGFRRWSMFPLYGDGAPASGRPYLVRGTGQDGHCNLVSVTRYDARNPCNRHLERLERPPGTAGGRFRECDATARRTPLVALRWSHSAGPRRRHGRLRANDGRGGSRTARDLAMRGHRRWSKCEPSTRRYPIHWATLPRSRRRTECTLLSRTTSIKRLLRHQKRRLWATQADSGTFLAT